MCSENLHGPFGADDDETTEKPQGNSGAKQLPVACVLLPTSFWCGNLR